MGYSLHQDVHVEITVRVTGKADAAATWTVNATATNRSQNVAGLDEATARAVADAADQALAHATAHGELLARRGAHRSDQPPTRRTTLGEHPIAPAGEDTDAS